MNVSRIKTVAVDLGGLARALFKWRSVRLGWSYVWTWDFMWYSAMMLLATLTYILVGAGVYKTVVVVGKALGA